MPTHTTARGAARLTLRLLTLALFLCAAGAEARAIDPCVLGLPSGSAVPAPDGIRGAHWNDAAVLASGQPCLPHILDGPAGNTADKTIRVYSKRYTANGQAVIGFFFEVQDTTTSCDTCPGGVLAFGERIVLQFDPDNDGPGDAALEADDRQIIITHKWGNAPSPQATVQVLGFNTDCPDPVWAPPMNPYSPAPTAFVRSDQVPGGGYTAEVVVPLALLGTPGADVGFAFAVINDSGECAGDVCNGFGAGFPNAGDDVVNTLRLADDENPVTPGCSTFGDWIEPDAWGTAAWGLSTGQVTVDRTPNYWSNDGLWVLECGAGSPVYTWYKDKPCRARLEARLTNATGSPQMRNLLFLWSEFGTGDPTTYKVVGLLEGQLVQPGVDVGPFTINFDNMPSGNAAHPCVRVYVLPLNYSADFPKPEILNITQRDGDGGLSDMVSVYNLGTDHWTQKNISAAAMGTVCPSCPVAGLRRAPGGDETAGVEAAPSWPRAGEAGGRGGRGPSDDASSLPVVYATADAGGAFRDSLFGAAQTATDPQRPPLVERPGRDVRLTRRDMERVAVDSVVVQVRTYGYGRPSGGPPRFNFIEQMGGVIQVIPVEVLRKLREVPFEFRVTNPRAGRTVYHRVDVYLSPNTDAEKARVSFDTRPSAYAAEESRVVRGFVTLPGGGGEGGDPKGEFRRWGLSLHAGVSIPHGNFDNVFNPGPNVGVDLEYRFNRRFSLEAVYTFNHFRGETLNFNGQSFTLDGTNIHNLSLNGKVYGGTSPVRPFFNFGGGVYVFDSATARGGVNVGGGLQFDLTPTVALDSMYNFHNVFGSGPNLRYSTAQGGVRFRF